MNGSNRRFDPTFAALKARLDSGELGTPECSQSLVAIRRHRSTLHQGIRRIFRDMLISDLDIFRWILEDDAETLHATGSCPTDPAVAEAGDIDCNLVTIRTRDGLLCQINTSRRAVYGYDQRFEVLGSKGMLQVGNVRPLRWFRIRIRP
jgi:myo-inositol 2-dehydrogenase / D-chiro-inositol 1-dehydrogenase